MNNVFKKSSTIILSIFLFALIFGAGFSIGNSNQFLSNSINAEEPLELDSFWKTYSILENKFVQTGDKEVSDQDKVYGAIQGLVESYDDPYTSFLLPKVNEEFEETISGVFVGVGMEVGMRDDFITVISPLKNSPAEKAGIESGDRIIAIDGESAIDLTVDDAVEKIRGEKGSIVKLTIMRDGNNEPINISIKRDTITIPTIDTQEQDNVFIISLYNFSATAPSEFRSALREFVVSDTEKLILDLRGNPGGFLDSAIEIASWFLPAGKTVAVEDFGDKREQKIFRSKGYDIFNEKLEMIVLVDGGSASASEIVSGALREHGIAKIVGKNTFGKGSVQELVEITEDTSLKVTIARWLTPEGKSISDGGLTPDIEVDLDTEKFEGDNPVDTQLQAAIEELNK